MTVLMHVYLHKPLSNPFVKVVTPSLLLGAENEHSCCPTSLPHFALPLKKKKTDIKLEHNIICFRCRALYLITTKGLVTVYHHPDDLFTHSVYPQTPFLSGDHQFALCIYGFPFFCLLVCIVFFLILHMNEIICYLSFSNSFNLTKYPQGVPILSQRAGFYTFSLKIHNVVHLQKLF